MDRKGSKQLYSKLFCIYTAILLCAISALVIYFYSSTKNRFLEQNMNYTEMMSEAAQTYLEDTSEIAEYIHEDLYKSNMELKDVLHYMSDEPQDYLRYRLNIYSENKNIEYKGIDKFFQNAFQAYSSLNHITLYSYERGEFTEYTRDGRSYRRNASTDFKQRFANDNLADKNYFSYLKEIRNPQSMQVKGCMILGFRSIRFESIWQYYSRAQLMVYNDSGTEVYNSADEYPAEDILKVTEKERLENRLEAYVIQTENAQYHTLSYLKKNEASKVPAPAVFMIIFTGIAVALLGGLLVRYHLQQLAWRLNRIIDGMARVMDGNLDVRIPLDKNGDELDVISGCFNQMCINLEEHIKKRYLAEIEQKNAEMETLQSQINPHFLYNTLEAIRMKAICNGDREVGKMLYSLAVTFRAQIKEADVITMAQELHYCKQYMELFEFRYQNQFYSVIECPDEYLKVPVIKFVLQPVVENYFIHGIRMKEEDNYIKIKVEKKGCYQIVAEDNGRGMTEAEIAAKNRELEQDSMEKQSSIGIANVNRRLKAVYGRAYGIRIETGPQGGLRVILRFQPAVTEEGGGVEQGKEKPAAGSKAMK